MSLEREGDSPIVFEVVELEATADRNFLDEDDTSFSGP
jgi:hypothetical protein